MMYIQQLIRVKFVFLCLTTYTGLNCTPASALSTDREQALEIEANAGKLDNIKNTSIYTGNVIVVQGSIRMTGEKMTVYFTEDKDIETLIMEGEPATFRQLPDNSTVYDEVSSRRMEYFRSKSLVILINEVKVKQEGSQFSGDRLVYNTLFSHVKAESIPNEQEIKSHGNGERVKIIITSKDD